MQEIEIWPYKQTVYAQPRTYPGKHDTQTNWDFEIKMDHLILARWPDLVIVNKKKRTFWIIDFAVPTDYRVNLKESEKKDKYLKLAKELKKLWNMKVTVTPIVISALGTVTKGLVQGLEDLEIRGWVATIQTTALLRLASI